MTQQAGRPIAGTADEVDAQLLANGLVLVVRLRVKLNDKTGSPWLPSVGSRTLPPGAGQVNRAKFGCCLSRKAQARRHKS